MDEETLMGISYTLVVSSFLFSWKYMPWNLPPIYPGMVMPTEMIIHYVGSIAGCLVAIFIWIFIGARE